MFYGDGLLCPPDGYGEGIVELLVMRRPDAAVKSFHPGEESLTLEAALRGAPSLIGKAPDLAYIALGAADALRGTDPDEALSSLRALLQVLRLKTTAHLAVANVCTAFLPSEARPAAAVFNAGLAALAAGGEDATRLTLVDLDGPVTAFLEAHRRGPGEKRSLHAQPLRLTSMGRLLLARAAFERLGLEERLAL